MGIRFARLVWLAQTYLRSIRNEMHPDIVPVQYCERGYVPDQREHDFCGERPRF